MNNRLISFLFQTNAFKIYPENEPVLLDSGLITPYFINAHFLYGNESDSTALLNFITNSLETENKIDIPGLVFEKILDQYDHNEVFRFTIDSMKALIEENIDVNVIDYISGGERKDWYFSMITAYLLGIPHISIFKDGTTIVSTCDFEESTDVTKLMGKRVLHISDLLEKANNYINYWQPIIQKLGSDILWSAATVDRLEGGKEILNTLKINSFSLINLDNSLLEIAHELNLITGNQLDILKNFKNDSYNYIRNFLISHPEFLQNALNSYDYRISKNARFCIDNNLYNL